MSGYWGHITVAGICLSIHHVVPVVNGIHYRCLARTAQQALLQVSVLPLELRRPASQFCQVLLRNLDLILVALEYAFCFPALTIPTRRLASTLYLVLTTS